MTASDEPDRTTADEESSEDDDESVPNGEEAIDALGRNPTQQRMAERGEPRVE